MLMPLLKVTLNALISSSGSPLLTCRNDVGITPLTHFNNATIQFDPSLHLIFSTGISMLTLSVRYRDSRPAILIPINVSIPALSGMFP